MSGVTNSTKEGKKMCHQLEARLGQRNTFKFILNDPSTPDMIINETYPEKPAVLDFKVDGLVPNKQCDSIDSLDNQAANCYANLCGAIRVLGKFAPQASRWAMVPTLKVVPRAGVQFNAFYDRKGLKFYYANDPLTKKTVYAVNSRDVVLHEMGHAVLDTIRPDLFNAVALEVWAFHEAFGDIHALINHLFHPKVIDYVLAETQGNLATSNLATKLAEEMGHAIFNVTRGKMGHSSAYMRDLRNDFVYTEPEKLPRAGRDDTLTAQAHSFSRVFSGAWYDALVGIHSKLVQSGKEPRLALEEARDTMARYTYGALGVAAANIRFYDALAKAMLVIDKAEGYTHNDVLNSVFVRRGILREAYRPFSGFNLAMAEALVTANDEVIRHDNFTAIRTKSTETLSLPDQLVNVEVPNDTFYEFDKDGECVNLVSYSADEIVDHANLCVDMLNQQGMVRPDRLSPWEVTEEGRLVRTNFSCCFYNNSELPGAPEFGKPHKHHLHSGCCRSPKTEEATAQPTVKRGCFVRHTGRNVVRLRAGCSVPQNRVC